MKVGESSGPVWQNFRLNSKIKGVNVVCKSLPQHYIKQIKTIEEPPSLADNSIRKTMSLPLLKPKLDRTAQLNSRPWRSRARGEDARFEPVGALKGIEPKPDPKYLEFVQFKLDKIEKRRWRDKQRERNATVVCEDSSDFGLKPYVLSKLQK